MSRITCENIVEQIDAHLQGRLTMAGLTEWAEGIMVGNFRLDPRHRDILMRTLVQLGMTDGGQDPDFALTRTELEQLRDRLARLAREQD
jgi:hypothetical protein